MALLPPSLREPFAKSRALKIISGISNFDPDLTAKVVRAADRGGADYVDIAADAGLVAMAKQLTQLPVCVSAVSAEMFVAPVRAGADLLEIGNYDSFYAQGVRFSAEAILQVTLATKQRFPSLPLTVTVPHYLLLDEQVALAERLEQAGADLIQTEGGTSSQPRHSGTRGLMEKAVPTLSACYEISRAVRIPVICASGLSKVTIPLAIACGAKGVGVGRAVNQLQNPVAMIATVRSLREALDSMVVLTTP
jgi:hypothetical protein